MSTSKLCALKPSLKERRTFLPGKVIALRTAIFAFLILLNFNSQAQETSDSMASGNSIFPKGEKAPAANFTGNVWLKVFVSDDTAFNYHMANVTFEPGARTHWHQHPGGQILLVTEGIGYYQEKGKPKKILRRGDMIKCPPGTEHWHGASPGSSFAHVGITNNSPKGRAVWLQPVTDQEYNSPK
jgi:quercetin dioxygenase-like cupin family protein